MAVAAVVAAVAVAVVEINMICNSKNRLLLQFHITGRCNLRCKHCYRTEGDVEPLGYDDIIKVIEQYKELLKSYNKLHNIKRRGHINITGGEPFIRKDIKQILNYLGENKESFSYGVLSNGSYVEDLIELLKETGVSFVQLSLDGDKKTHDLLRGKNDYSRVLKTAKMLEKNKIRTYISFTANKDNYKHLPLVANECRKRGITKLWSDRIVPIGNGKEIEELAITPDVLPDYLRTLRKAQGGLLAKLLSRKTEVTMNRALQFMEGGGIYVCSAGNSLITVDEFGNIMPCRRMPVICGNIFKSTLEKVYFENEVFKSLRIPTIPEECRRCLYKDICQGGARCQSYAIHNDFLHADVGCPLKR